MPGPWTLSLAPHTPPIEDLVPDPARETASEDAAPRDAAHQSALEALTAGSHTEDELVALGRETSGFQGLRTVYTLLFGLHARCLLRRSLWMDGRQGLTLTPTSDLCPWSIAEVDPQQSHGLSRFALVRRDGDRLLLESPRGRAQVTLHGPSAVGLIGPLAGPVDGDRLAAALGITLDMAAHALALLHHANVLTPFDDGGRPLEDDSPALRPWAFHDLLLHNRSRLGSHIDGYGATYPFRGITEPQPAIAPERPGRAVELPRPDLDHCLAHDPPFARVLEDRRSRRQHGDPPIRLEQLGELLYRAARIVETLDGEHYSLARRPYPGGGGAWELEIYPVVHRCAGLAPALYHYRADTHRLVELAPTDASVQRLLDNAAHIAGTDDPPQVLLLLAARFGRLSWKYESMAYATVLKDVGVLLQTFYLVGTAMDLAVSALGGGNSDLFAQITGIDPLEESTVGELIVGSRVRD